MMTESVHQYAALIQKRKSLYEGHQAAKFYILDKTLTFVKALL